MESLNPPKLWRVSVGIVGGDTNPLFSSSVRGSVGLGVLG